MLSAGSGRILRTGYRQTLAAGRALLPPPAADPRGTEQGKRFPWYWQCISEHRRAATPRPAPDSWIKGKSLDGRGGCCCCCSGTAACRGGRGPPYQRLPGEPRRGTHRTAESSAPPRPELPESRCRHPGSPCLVSALKSPRNAPPVAELNTLLFPLREPSPRSPQTRRRVSQT